MELLWGLVIGFVLGAGSAAMVLLAFRTFGREEPGEEGKLTEMSMEELMTLAGQVADEDNLGIAPVVTLELLRWHMVK